MQQPLPASPASIDSFYGTAASSIGPWKTVWGPAIFESTRSSSSYPDNSINVAYSADLDVYMVGAAGTNPLSTFDITQEDLDVIHTVAWDAAFPSLLPYGIPGSLSTLKPYLSAGTALGVNNLLSLVDTLQGTNQNLVTFLGSLSSTSSSTLIFGGHSLAAALMPTLALALFNPAQGKLTMSNWGHVYVYPTAGPTPGNADFGTFLSAVFPQVPPPGSTAYEVWNANVWNTLDIGPYAWDVSTLQEVATIYPASWTRVPIAVQGPIDAAILASEVGANTGAGPYTRIANQSVPGTLDPKYPVSDGASFLAQAGYQHTTAYDALLNVTILGPGARMQSAYAPLIKALFTLPPGK